MRYYKSFKLIRRVIPYPDIRSSQSFVDWQNRLLFVLMAGLVIMGFIAYIPGWIVNSINFIVVTSLISLALAVIITNIDKSLKKEKRMIHLLGGKIWLKSEIGKGSEFYFTLPYNEKADGLISNSPKAGNGKKPDFSDKLIYIAEDDSPSYFYLTEILSKSAVQIKRAQNGKELLQLIGDKVPDLVLLDIRMPVMSGLEALSEIKKIHPNLPVIAQTAYAMPEERKKCLDSGCDDYISKPINKSALLTMIESYLQAT